MNAGAYVGALADLIFPPWETDRLMVVLGGYFDESGTHENADVLVVGGFVAEPPKWRRFSNRWQQALLRAGLDPTVTPFHMTDYVRRVSPFDWPEPKRTAIIAKLTGLIAETALVGISVGVKLKDYEAAGPVLRDAPSAYGFAAVIAFALVSQWGRYKGLKGEVAYVFEDGAEHRGEIDAAHQHITKDPRWRSGYFMGPLAWGSKKKLMPLQAADICSWETRRYAMTAMLRNDEGLRRSLQAIMPIGFHSAYLDRVEIEKIQLRLQKQPEGPTTILGAES